MIFTVESCQKHIKIIHKRQETVYIYISIYTKYIFIVRGYVTICHIFDFLSGGGVPRNARMIVLLGRST